MTQKERIDRHDREIAAIRRLMMTGMKMLVRSEKRTDSLNTAIAKLQASQQKTDVQLQALIRSLRGGSNGHSKN